MRTETLCRTCRYLSGCDLLMTKDWVFDLRRASTDSNPKECKRWDPVGYTQGTVRLKLLEDFGPAALASIHMLPAPEITEQEETVAVDFLKMAGNGVTYNERAAQLRYMTDDEGNLLLDDGGEKIPRLSYDLRKYATDPNGPVQAQETVVLFWTPKQLVDEILKAEKEAGIVISPQEKRKLNKGAASAPKKEENVAKMNIKKGSLKGGGSKPASVGGFRLPATKKKVEEPEDDGGGEDDGADDNGYRSAAPQKARGNGKSKAESPSLSAEELSAAFTPIMQEIAEEAAKKAVEGFVDALDKQKEAILTAVKENQDVVIGGITVLHDVLAPNVTGDEERTLIDKGADILAYFEGDEGNDG